MVFYATNGYTAKVVEKMAHIKRTLPHSAISREPSSRFTPRIGERATVAILVGMTAPVLAMGVALGIEVSGWTVIKQRMQRAADIAATAAAESFLNGASAQQAATYGAYIAEMNNVAGASSRAWSGSQTTGTLSDNNISIAVATGVGIINPADTTFAVTVQSPAPTAFGAFAFPGGITKTITTSAIAEIATAAGTGGQPCLLTLQDYGGGTTTGYGIQVSGASQISAESCTIRSDDGISVSGSAEIEAGYVFSSGTIQASGEPSIDATGIYASATSIPSYLPISITVESVPQLRDPYATSAVMQAGIAKAATCSGGTAFTPAGWPAPTSQTISPGCYSSISVGGVFVVTMQPGVYYVSGDINVSASGQLLGSGVTIFSNGRLMISGASPVTLKAPLGPPSVNWPTAGIVYASNYTDVPPLAGQTNPCSTTPSITTSVCGSGTFSFTGLFYYPNGAVNISGASTYGQDDGCSEMIVKSINFSGSTSLAANNCHDSYGLLPFSAMPGTSSTTLVQ